MTLQQIDWWLWLSILLVIIEALVRIVPTTKSYSALTLLSKILNAVIPDKKKFKNNDNR